MKTSLKRHFQCTEGSLCRTRNSFQEWKKHFVANEGKGKVFYLQQKWNTKEYYVEHNTLKEHNIYYMKLHTNIQKLIMGWEMPWNETRRRIHVHTVTWSDADSMVPKGMVISHYPLAYWKEHFFLLYNVVTFIKVYLNIIFFLFGIR